MRITILAVLAALVGGVVVTATADAYQNCTTNCQRYGNQTSCQRTCF
jgi:hypothetical protein